MSKNIFLFTIFILITASIFAQASLEGHVQSYGAVISNTTGNIESTIIVGEPIVSGVIDHPFFGGSSFGFLGQSVENDPPMADAGPNQEALVGDLITLDGTNSFDPNTNPLTYAWTSLDGLTLNNPNSAQPTLNAPNVLGRAIFRFQLIVNDGQEDSAPDIVEITVSDPAWVTVVYTLSSSLIAKVTIDGVPAEEGDLVGAFVEGECRGVDEVTIFEGEAYVSFNLQGETPATANFRVVDLSEGIICDANSLAFSPPQGYGDPVNPILIQALCGNGGNCDGITLSNFTNPVPGGTYKASNEIISDDLINLGTTVVFQAANSISLQPGFHAQAGSNFTAIIQDCSTNPQVALRPDTEMPATGIEPSIHHLKLYPNPFSTGFQLSFQLNSPQRVGIRILDLHGRLINQPEFLDLDAGVFSKTYHLTGVPPGNYIVQILSNSQYLENQRVVKMR